jgi:antitoxin component YwqK of YwqJK toxin-antitoxin module
VIALLAALLAAAPPLVCPAEAEHRGGQPMEGFEEWCVVLPPEGKERREGPAVSYYEDGTVWIERRYREGELDGPFRELHRGGRTAREGAYAAGFKTGLWRVWAEDGTLLEESRWERGERHGPFASFWPSGKPRSRGRHCRGIQCGRWVSFDERGAEQGTVDYGEVRGEP